VYMYMYIYIHIYIHIYIDIYLQYQKVLVLCMRAVLLLHMIPYSSYACVYPHEKLLGITRVSNPATRKDLASRTWGVFWYKSKMQVLFEIMVHSKQKGGAGVESPPPRSFSGGVWMCVWYGYVYGMDACIFVRRAL